MQVEESDVFMMLQAASDTPTISPTDPSLAMSSAHSLSGMLHSQVHQQPQPVLWEGHQPPPPNCQSWLYK